MQSHSQNRDEGPTTLKSDLTAAGNVGLTLVALILGSACVYGVSVLFTAHQYTYTPYTISDLVRILTVSPRVTAFLIALFAPFALVAGVGFSSAVRRVHQRRSYIQSSIVVLFSIALLAACLWAIWQCLIANADENFRHVASAQMGWTMILFIVMSYPILTMLSISIAILLAKFKPLPLPMLNPNTTAE